MVEPIGESGFLEYKGLKIDDIASVKDFSAYSVFFVVIFTFAINNEEFFAICYK